MQISIATEPEIYSHRPRPGPFCHYPPFTRFGRMGGTQPPGGMLHHQQQQQQEQQRQQQEQPFILIHWVLSKVESDWSVATFAYPRLFVTRFALAPVVSQRTFTRDTGGSVSSRFRVSFESAPLGATGLVSIIFIFINQELVNVYASALLTQSFNRDIGDIFTVSRHRPNPARISNRTRRTEFAPKPPRTRARPSTRTPIISPAISS